MSAAAGDLRSRLTTALDRLAGSGRRADAETILRERSRALARRSLEDGARRVLGEVVVVRRGSTLLAAPLKQAREVRLVELVRVPGATDTILGMFQVRGRTCALADIGPLLGAATGGTTGSSRLTLVVSGAPGDLGLLIDEVVGARTVFADELAEPSDEQRLEIVAHLTRDLVHIIDVEAVLALPTLRLRGIA